jgi:hypothetical protein
MRPAGLPAEAELAMVWLRVAEQVLSDVELEARWWEPARRTPAESPSGLPTALTVDYRWNRPAQAGSPV